MELVGATISFQKYHPQLFYYNFDPCLKTTKVSNPKATVIHILSYNFAKTVGSHLDSLESVSKNIESCYFINC